MADQSNPYHHHPLPSAPNEHQQSYPQQYQGQPQHDQYDQQQQSQAQYYQPPASQQQYQQDSRPQTSQQYQQGQQQAQQYPQPVRPQPTHQQQSHSKSRTLSFQSQKSQKSHKSSGSKEKVVLHETHAEKEAKRLHSKADPSLAISEDEPSVVAMTQSSLAPLRAITHKDPLGNPIADPDKSNPTRSRWERPLDTIRSFEAAIDGGYSRKSIYRAETDSQAGWNRRSSFNPTPQPRFQRDSYYSQRPNSYRPDVGGYDGGGPSRNSYFDQQGGYGGPYGQGPQQGAYNQGPPRRMSRMQTEPQYSAYGREQNVYPMPHKDRSYETVTSAAASGNSDHAGYQTDPTSSDNSSIDRRSPAKRQEQPRNDYGIGFNQSQSLSPQNFTVGVPNGGSGGGHPLPAVPGAQQQAPPAVPRKDVPAVLRRQATNEQNGEKRKSWFARRFSKNN